MDGRECATAVIYICWDCGEDFKVAERDGLPDRLEITCPGCGSDLVAVDVAAVRPLAS
jgi:DNA-directed RNA polymerase subunit RPC12/RpoP